MTQTGPQGEKLRVPPPYLMNTETREIYAYSEALERMASPKFVPYHGKVPPPDFRRGVPVAPQEVAIDTEDAVETPENRVETIAGVIHLVPKEEISDSGQPSLVIIEKMTHLKNVTRKEVNAAMKMRVERLNAPAEKAKEREEELAAAAAVTTNQ